MKVCRHRVAPWRFWGFLRLKGGGWRFGFGRGFVQWGKHRVPGIYLHRKVKTEAELAK